MWLYLAALLGLYFLRRWYKERQMVENLMEKYVFITGCDSGFGNLLAKQLDARGLWVLAACLTQKGAEQLGKATSERLKTTILDVSSSESVAAATEWVKGCIGNKGDSRLSLCCLCAGIGSLNHKHTFFLTGLWGLVNNAGTALPSGPNEWLTKDDFAKVINVNLLGMIDVTLHMVPLVRRARGRVVNISSVNGRLSVFGGGYCPSKFGVEAFSDSLRQELHPFGVQVSIIEPGTFRTNIGARAVENLKTVWNQVPSDIKEVYGEQYFENYCKIAQYAINIASSKLHLVTDCMEHALTSCSPRTRYSAGWDAKFLHIPASYFPTSIVDFVVSCIQPKPAQAV